MTGPPRVRGELLGSVRAPRSPPHLHSRRCHQHRRGPGRARKGNRDQDPGRWSGAVRRGDALHLLRGAAARSEEHTSELQSRGHLVCRLLLEKKKKNKKQKIEY